MNIKWQKVTGCTYRLKVFGGWMLVDRDINHSTAIFVPDPDHLWEIT